MFEVKRDYPTALAADPKQPNLALRTAFQWVVAKQREVGGSILLYAPGKQNIDGNNLLAEFCRRAGVQVATWRTGAWAWDGGPVLAAWPSRNKLAEIADHHGVRALCVVPWADGEVDAWATAANPELLLGAEEPAVRAVTDPVVVEGLKSLTLMVNHSNHLASALDRRDAVAVLTTLHLGGHRLDADAIYAWSLANGWPGQGAERLREMAEKISSGVRMRTGTRESPLRSDVLNQWREKASAK
ncbi:MAG TPA: hypothetical protein VGJ63_11820 [Micromonosporaceae bacterium]|jgi:hypothetical protein